jgi:mono/diheme cytochrome c family protein
MRAGRIRWVAVPALVAICGMAHAAGPVAKGDPVKGKLVYVAWCTECHGRGPGHPGTQSLEVKYRGQTVPAVLEDRTDLAPPVTTSFVRHGVALMPQFRKTEISDAQLRDLAAYLAKGK